MTEIDPDLSEAVMVYTGKGTTKTPQEDELRVVDRFGDTLARPLLKKLDRIIADLDAFRVDWSKVSLGDGGRLAQAFVAERYPELTEEACSALGWLYTWWWK
ncbi:MAG: hypothetical protein R3D83_04045 [Caenibius sp.]